jgi:hypothetical protein
MSNSILVTCNILPPIPFFRDNSLDVIVIFSNPVYAIDVSMICGAHLYH